MPEGSLYLGVMILQPIPLLPVIDTDLVRFEVGIHNETEPAALSRGGLGLFIAVACFIWGRTVSGWLPWGVRPARSADVVPGLPPT